MTIGSCVLHHKSHTLRFNIPDLEGSVLLSCAHRISLALIQAIDKLNKELSSGAKLVTSHVARYEVPTIYKKTDTIQGSHLSMMTKFHDISIIFPQISRYNFHFYLKCPPYTFG